MGGNAVSLGEVDEARIGWLRSVSAGFYHSGLCLQLGETLVSIASYYVYKYCTTRKFVGCASYR